MNRKPNQNPTHSCTGPKGADQTTIWTRLLVGLVVLSLAVLACAPQDASTPAQQEPKSGKLIVFAAASLTESFGEICSIFESEHSGVEISLNLASSYQLAQQLAQGAPADVFASANNTQMANAIEAGRIAKGSQRTFVRNKLVVVYPKDNPAGLQTLQDLAQPDLKLVLAAQEVPVGKYSLELLEKASQDPDLGAAFKDGVLENVVSYEDTVKAVFAKVVLGEGDAGIVYLTDISLDNADKVDRIEIPDNLNSVATYPIAPVSDSAEPELAQAFIELILSPQGQEIMAKYGFAPPE